MYRPPSSPPKPKRRRPPAAPGRSRSLASKEGGIVRSTPPPRAPQTPRPRSRSTATREGEIGQQPRWTAAQRRIANQLVSGYERGPRIGNLGRALDRAGKVYEDNPIARNPIVGRKGLLGGLEDLVKSADPITLGQTLKKTAEHPLASRSETGLNAGMVVGGPGGFRVARPREAAADVVERPRTKVEAQTRLDELDKLQEKFHKALVGKHKSVLPAEQARLNAAKGLARKAAKSTKPIKGGKRAARVEQPQGTVADAFLQRTVDEAVAKHPDHPAVKAYLANIAEANQLREALSSKHMPGEEPLPADYGTVRVPAPRRGPLVEQAKVADRPALEGLGRTPEQAASVVAGELGAARRVYAEQKKGYSAERTARVARGVAAREAAGGGMAGQRAFLREQRGALPKETFDRLQKRQLTQTDLENLANTAWEHPELQPYDKATAVEALRKAVEEQKTPAPHEIELLRQIYGDKTAKALAKPSLLQHIGKLALEVINTPRAIMSTLDLSFGGRQGLMAGVMHPRIWAGIWPKAARSFASHAYATKLDEAVRADPNYEIALKAGVPFTREEGPMGVREEQHISQLPEKIPVFGRAVKASNRAYVAFGNSLRMGMFNRQLELARRQGRNTEEIDQLRNIANLVGNATGRGTLGPMESWAPALNVGFFAPRLIASRVNFLNPIWYAKRDHFARVQALKGLIGLAGAGSAVLGLAYIAGAKVGLDPTSADFAKIRVRNSRADIFGGFQQYIRLSSQLVEGHITSSTTGRALTLGPGYGQLNKKDILERFAVGKFNPPAAFVYDYFKGTDYQGRPFSWKRATLQRMIPLVVQDTSDVYQGKDTIPAAALTYAIAAVGVGMQNYGPREPLGEKQLKTATAHQNVHLDRLVKIGELPRSQRAEYREALDIYDKRNALNSAIESATKDKPLTREKQKMDALLGLLAHHKLLKPAEVKRYRQHYASADLTPKELRADREWFWRNSGVGSMVTWYRDKAGATD